MQVIHALDYEFQWLRTHEIRCPVLNGQLARTAEIWRFRVDCLPSLGAMVGRIISGRAAPSRLSDRCSNRMAVALNAVMDRIESTFGQLGDNFFLREEVDVIWLEPITNFRGLPTKNSLGNIGY
jgi:hypothetical protein